MANKWVELWRNSTQNAEIAATASEQFCDLTSDRKNRSKYGSMNFLFLTNRSNYPLKVFLDGVVFTELFANAALIITPEDGLYFDLLKLENLDLADAIVLNLITVRYGRSQLVNI